MAPRLLDIDEGSGFPLLGSSNARAPISDSGSSVPTLLVPDVVPSVGSFSSVDWSIAMVSIFESPDPEFPAFPFVSSDPGDPLARWLYSCPDSSLFDDEMSFVFSIVFCSFGAIEI